MLEDFIRQGRRLVPEWAGSESTYCMYLWMGTVAHPVGGRGGRLPPQRDGKGQSWHENEKERNEKANIE